MTMSTTKKVRLRLVGLDGNAFNLLGKFEAAARRQGWEPDEIAAVLDEAMSGAYSHLVGTLARHCEDPAGEAEEDE
jgi:hypothetical protein